MIWQNYQAKMQEIDRIVIPLKNAWPVQSLVWQGDELVDWVSGGTRYLLNQKIIPAQRIYAYSFDQAKISPDHAYVAIFQRMGTKGLILKQGAVLREINRSYYQAEVYEYPITFLTLPDGRAGIAHCPNEYCKIEIEEVESGQNLTKRAVPTLDFFHSRLQVSGDNCYLLSAGWVWSPFDHIQVYDLTQVYPQPALLDAPYTPKYTRAGVEVSNAVFRDRDTLILTTHDAWYEPGEVEEDEQNLLEPNTIGVYNLTTDKFISQAPLEEPAGTMLPLGDFVVGFNKYPKMIDLNTGRVTMRWQDLDSGEQNSSIIWHISKLPPLALDATNKRFAVAANGAITVIQLG